MQHDVLAFFDLLHAIDAQRQAMNPFLLLGRNGYWRADDRGLALEDRFGLPEMIRDQGGAGGDQIANEIRSAQSRRDLDGTR